MIGEIARINAETEHLEAVAVEMLVTRYQTGDIRSTVKMLTSLVEKTRTPITKWPAIFAAIAAELFKGNLEIEGIASALQAQFPVTLIEFAYRRLRRMRSVVTTGESYRESRDGELSTGPL
jgi:hypothetical protein